MAVTIAVESPLQDDVRSLIAALNATLLELTPAEFCTHLTVEQMAGADTTVFIARDEVAAVACGALKRHGEGIGEVKRMYTEPAPQGRNRRPDPRADRGEAREDGLTRLVLETGHLHDAAWRVTSAGASLVRAGARLPGHRLLGLLREALEPDARPRAAQARAVSVNGAGGSGARQCSRSRSVDVARPAT